MRRRSIQAGLWWGAALATLVTTAAWFGANEVGIPAFDREGLTLANVWRTPWLDAAFLGLTWLGSLMVLLPLVLAAGILLWRRGYRGEARFLMAALVGASLLAQMAKHLALRQRPDLFAALTWVASPLSFPSAHAVQATAVAVSSLVVVARLAPRHVHWAAPLLISVLLLVGLSRIHLQVHFPSDVLAGSIAAGFWVAGLHALTLTANPAADT
ncbi:MAG: phosphatase PAP2 family protein [Sulfuritalea sp.]|nr:phosphatase PAP2 family protein [Sulfuritalea sp.]